mgnify:CR=1 FL=1
MEDKNNSGGIISIEEYRKKKKIGKEGAREAEVAEARRAIIERLRGFKTAFKPEIEKLEESAKIYFREINLLKTQVTFKPENYAAFCRKVMRGPILVETAPVEPTLDEKIYAKIFEEKEKYATALENFDNIGTSWHMDLFSFYRIHRGRQLVTKSIEFLSLEKALNVLTSFNKKACEESLLETRKTVKKYKRLLESIYWP